MQKWIGLGAILLLLSACQSKSNSVSQLPKPSDGKMSFEAPRTLDPSDQLSDLLNHAIVTCEDGKCPEGVATLLNWEPSKGPIVMTYECTAFLVSTTIAATNSHCIPDLVKQHPELCATYVGLKFPAQNDKPTEGVACDRLIQASDIPPEDTELKVKFVDFAFIRLNRVVKRNSFVLSREGVKDETSLTLYSSDPEAKRILPDKTEDPNMYLTIRKKICVSKQNTILLPQYSVDNADFVVGLGSACTVRKGNSGSPAMTDEGRVVAIFYSGDTHAVDRIGDYLHSIDGTGDTKPFARNGFFVNLACLNVAKEVGLAPKPADCLSRDQRQKTSTTLAIANTVKDENDEIHRVSEEWQESAPKMFRYRPNWDMPDDPSKRQIVTMDYQLKCLYPKEYWPSIDPTASDNRLTVKYTSRVLVFQYQLDNDGRRKKMKISDQTRHISLSIDAALVGTSDSVVGTKVVDGVSASFSTHWCSKEEIAMR